MLVIFFGGLFLAEHFIKEVRAVRFSRGDRLSGCFIIIGLQLGALVACGLVFTWLH